MSKITGQDVANTIEEARTTGEDGPAGISEQEWNDIRGLIEEYKDQSDIASFFGFGAQARKNTLVGALGFGSVGRDMVENLWNPKATYAQFAEVIRNNPLLGG